MWFGFKRPYLYIFIGVFLAYSMLLYFISDFGITLSIAFQYAETVNWYKIIFSILFSLIIASLISINSCYLYRNYLVRKKCKDGSTLVGAGAIGGMAVGVCPVCVSGILPIVLGALGISFSLGALPFQGLEIQVLIIAVLGFGFYKLKGDKGGSNK